MIKLTGFGFQDTLVEATVSFDYGGETYSRAVSVQSSQLLNMTVGQITTWIINYVTGQRRQLGMQIVESLLQPLIDVDLEV